MVRNHRIAICLASILLVAAADAVAQETGKGADAQSEPLAFGLSRKGTATVDDAYRLFLTMAVGHERVAVKKPVSELSFDEVTAHLVALCVIDAEWCYAADTCLRRDVLAYMCTGYMGCRPGLITGAFGMTRRYAHREMMYQRVIPSGPPGTLASGSELLAVATRVERRIQPRRDVQLRDDQIH